MKPDLVRVIRDVRNGNRDYWIPRKRAEELLAQKLLEQVYVYEGRLDYHHATKFDGRYE